MTNRFNRTKSRVDELELKLKSLKKHKIDDYCTKELLDYLIGDDINCPICGSKMRFNALTATDYWHNEYLDHYTLTCPSDSLTIHGLSLKECIDQLHKIHIVKTEE